MREVSIEIHACYGIFAHETVTVEIAPLEHCLVCGDFALVSVCTPHDARVCRVDNVRCDAAWWRNAAHEGDHAVAVEVFRRIFIDLPIAIVIDSTRVGRARKPSLQRHGARVGIRAEDDMDANLIKHGGMLANELHRCGERLFG